MEAKLSELTQLMLH